MPRPPFVTFALALSISLHALPTGAALPSDAEPQVQKVTHGKEQLAKFHETRGNHALLTSGHHALQRALAAIEGIDTPPADPSWPALRLQKLGLLLELLDAFDEEIEQSTAWDQHRRAEPDPLRALYEKWSKIYPSINSRRALTDLDLREDYQRALERNAELETNRQIQSHATRLRREELDSLAQYIKLQFQPADRESIDQTILGTLHHEQTKKDLKQRIDGLLGTGQPGG
jgi:hypothetical protein